MWIKLAIGICLSWIFGFHTIAYGLHDPYSGVTFYVPDTAVRIPFSQVQANKIPIGVLTNSFYASKSALYIDGSILALDTGFYCFLIAFPTNQAGGVYADLSDFVQDLHNTLKSHNPSGVTELEDWDISNIPKDLRRIQAAKGTPNLDDSPAPNIQMKCFSHISDSVELVHILFRVRDYNYLLLFCPAQNNPYAQDKRMIKTRIEFDSPDSSLTSPVGSPFKASAHDTDWPQYLLYGILGVIVLAVLGGIAKK